MLSECDNPLRTFLRDQPRKYGYNYSEEARLDLLQALFTSMAANNDGYLRTLFPNETDAVKNSWSLSRTQGGVEGAEYTEGARGKACGHIFKPGEASYRCKQCATDPMCTLCSKCFEASDHEGHQVAVSVNQGTPGSCDCGDPEAWKVPLKCAIHSELEPEDGMDIDHSSKLPPDFQNAIRQSISTALDYVLDIISCSPEHFRLPKSKESILKDEEMSRLTSRYYANSSEDADDDMEYSVLIWNDEKHTIVAVQNQVARACKKTKAYGLEKGEETDRVGRALVERGKDIDKLLSISKVIEQIKLTVTIRSSRDTFREEMCATIIEWLLDISSCAVGPDNHILRRTVCEELLEPWKPGSKAGNVEIGRYGIDDHSLGESMLSVGHYDIVMQDDDDDGDEDDDDAPGQTTIHIDIPPQLRAPIAQPLVNEAQTQQQQPPTAADPAVIQHGDDVELAPAQVPPPIPETPAKNKPNRQRKNNPPPHWLTRPSNAKSQNGLPPYEDLRQRVRLDWLILFDLRFWKKSRIDIRDLFIGTVIAIPQFKRVIGLRFAGLYTILSQLFLIADREPDRSIIHMSFQMLSAPSTVVEVVEKANFITVLMAIIYTFLTTRQVGYPADVDPDAPLSMETGNFTSRRLFNIFHSIRILCEADYVRECIRTDAHYLLQFLDIAQLHHGLCPNIRAKDKHIEYEPESWISAGLIMREINRLGMQMAQSFALPNGDYASTLERAISQASSAAILMSLGLDKRDAEEVDSTPTIEYGKVSYEWESQEGKPWRFKVVKYNVDSQPMSFHHPLHYTLSWMIEIGKGMPAGHLLSLMKRDVMDYDMDDSEADSSDRTNVAEFDPRILAFFDYPLRVCVWLAQMKAGLWVRNGFSLRHQMQTYRGTFDRDYGLNRDLLLLQTALVTLNPSLVLANMVERYSLSDWVVGVYTPPESWEQAQLLDVAEDFLHLLIALLCERNALIPAQEEPNLEALKIQREVAHVLCFKPITYSELTARLPDKVTDSERFMEVLEEMTNFRDPEGISDSGTFELKDSYKDKADPYYIHFTRNQREETETSFRNRVAKATGKPPQDAVFQPSIYKIRTGLFSRLPDFVRTGIFAQIIFYSLRYGIVSETDDNIPATRVESFLLMALHLCQIGVQEDSTAEQKEAGEVSSVFVDFFTLPANNHGLAKEDAPTTIAGVLNYLSNSKVYPACGPKAKHILALVKEKNPGAYANIAQFLDMPQEVEDTRKNDEAEKKRLAEERRNKIMASFKQQQQTFMSTAGFNFDDIDMDEDEDYEFVEPEKKVWKYPAGTCIVCQEEMDEDKLYGNLVMVQKSSIFRTTPMHDPDFLGEVCQTPSSLDRNADHLRPFGVAASNKIKKTSLATDGTQKVSYVTGLGKGFPSKNNLQGPVAISCNHAMHFQCFEQYYEATKKRHHQQNSRKHPERLEKKEFVCPLCKALGNAFFPIIWKSKSEGSIETEIPFEPWLDSTAPVLRNWKSLALMGQDTEVPVKILELGGGNMMQPLATKVQNLQKAMKSDAEGINLLSPIASSSTEAFGLPSQRLANAITTTTTINIGGNPGVPGAPGPAGPPIPITITEMRPLNAQTAALQEVELYKIYVQLRDSFVANDIRSWRAADNQVLSLDLVNIDTLVHLLGYTIESVEITQRGVTTDTEATLLESIPEQTLSLLRILSETVNSYITVGGLANRDDGYNATLKQYHNVVDYQIGQIFPDPNAEDIISKFCRPLFADDMFVVLTEASVFLGPGKEIDIHHLLRLLYTAEILKFAFSYVRTELPDDETLNKNYVWPGSEFRLLSELLGYMDEHFAKYTLKKANYYPAFFGTLLEKYALIFLRKALILLHTRHGFQPASEINPNDSELVRLSRHLKLPSISQIIKEFLDESPNNTAGRNLRSLLDGWVHQFLFKSTATGLSEESVAATETEPEILMPHPAIYELVGLPDGYGVLMDEAVRRKCPTTGKDMTEPALCFFCGDIFCSQAFCCEKDKKGGCTQHMLKCGKNVGAFLNIRKCALIYLHGDKDSVNGTFTAAPYLDRYGEIDQGLKRTRPLFLNRKRYDALLRKVWLNHGIPAIISRKLEAETNNGGWETL